MLPKLVSSLLAPLKASTTAFESREKFIPSNRKSTTHWSAWLRPRASPTSTEHIDFASTKLPSKSRMHIHMPNLLEEWEKDVSILHLNLPEAGRRHWIPLGMVGINPTVVPCVLSLLRRSCANFQSSNICLTLPWAPKILAKRLYWEAETLCNTQYKHVWYLEPKKKKKQCTFHSATI